MALLSYFNIFTRDTAWSNIIHLVMVSSSMLKRVIIVCVIH